MKEVRALPRHPLSGAGLELIHVPAEQVRFDDEGQFLNSEGDVVNVVHQYDRHPELDQRVHERFGGQGDAAEVSEQ